MIYTIVATSFIIFVRSQDACNTDADCAAVQNTQLYCITNPNANAKQCTLPCTDDFDCMAGAGLSCHGGGCFPDPCTSNTDCDDCDPFCITGWVCTNNFCAPQPCNSNNECTADGFRLCDDYQTLGKFCQPEKCRQSTDCVTPHYLCQTVAAAETICTPPCLQDSWCTAALRLTNTYCEVTSGYCYATQVIQVVAGTYYQVTLDVSGTNVIVQYFVPSDGSASGTPQDVQIIDHGSGSTSDPDFTNIDNITPTQNTVDNELSGDIIQLLQDAGLPNINNNTPLTVTSASQQEITAAPTTTPPVSTSGTVYQVVLIVDDETVMVQYFVADGEDTPQDLEIIDISDPSTSTTSEGDWTMVSDLGSTKNVVENELKNDIVQLLQDQGFAVDNNTPLTVVSAQEQAASAATTTTASAGEESDNNSFGEVLTGDVGIAGNNYPLWMVIAIGVGVLFMVICVIIALQRCLCSNK